MGNPALKAPFLSPDPRVTFLDSYKPVKSTSLLQRSQIDKERGWLRERSSLPWLGKSTHVYLLCTLMPEDILGHKYLSTQTPCSLLVKRFFQAFSCVSFVMAERMRPEGSKEGPREMLIMPTARIKPGTATFSWKREREREERQVKEREDVDEASTVDMDPGLACD